MSNQKIKIRRRKDEDRLENISRLLQKMLWFNSKKLPRCVIRITTIEQLVPTHMRSRNNQQTDQHGMAWCGVVLVATNCHTLRAVELCKTSNEYIKRGKKKLFA